MRYILPVLLVFSAAALAGDHAQTCTVDEALSNLRKGNERFVKGKPNVWDSGSAKREHLTAGQTPYACVITCSDSRVPPEQIFDAGLGELFVIRVAGNVASKEVVASADYAVGHLHCPVVIVMGHTNCGAVGAALSDSDFPEPLNTLIEEIRPSVEACESKGYGSENLYAGAIKENARNSAAALLSGSLSIEQAVADGECVVLSAVYDLATGAVQWQSQMGAAKIAQVEPKKEAKPKVTHEPKPAEPTHESVAKTEKKYTDTPADQTQSSRSSKRDSKYKH
ncbi:MAG: carbonic anhydrase [Calditrichaeota bacterium]|nr:carbonic anhydrase [Calditrichota bacterium]MCB9368864.1 carbonic anhydrase [Calditrichota bacterium]